MAMHTYPGSTTFPGPATYPGLYDLASVDTDLFDMSSPALASFVTDAALAEFMSTASTAAYATAPTLGYLSFPVTGVLDDFNRSVEGPPPSASWLGNWYGGSPGMFTQETQVMESQAYGAAYWAEAFDADQECFVTLVGAFPDAQVTGLIVRLSNPGAAHNGYVSLWTQSSQVYFRKDVAGEETFLSGYISVDPFSDGDTIGMRVVGDRISAYVNGLEQTSVTDSSVTGSGRIGIFASNAQMQYDDFGGGDWVQELMVWQLDLTDSAIAAFVTAPALASFDQTEPV